jgi:glutamate racemase
MSAAQTPSERAALAELPIGMFDSGIGGLTVLHECLVAMPAEDFVYFGDTARFPYGSKTQAELECFSAQIAAFLAHAGVKLIVVACNSATAAALPVLQARFDTPIVGAIMPGAWAAVQSSRSRRIGVLATPATVASGSYPRAVHSLDAAAEVFQQACPDLAGFIQDGEVATREVLEAVKTYTAPLKAKRVDVVIMGSTHYPHVAPMLQRAMGRGVTLVSPAAEIALEVEEMLARQGVAQDDDREGDYRFYCTGDVETFRSIGARFLQMPLERVEQISLDELRPPPGAGNGAASRDAGRDPDGGGVVEPVGGAPAP